MNKEKILEGLSYVRGTAKTNMFDVHMVQRIAFDSNYCELMDFIEENRKAYSHLILTGEFPNGVG